MKKYFIIISVIMVISATICGCLDDLGSKSDKSSSRGYDVIVVDKMSVNGKHCRNLICCRDLNSNKSMVVECSFFSWLEIETGKKYHIDIAGFESHMLGIYPWLVSYKEIE